MNKQVKLLAAAAALAIAPATHAATIGPTNFNVTVALTTVCQLTAGPSDVAFTYTSFQAGAAASAGGVFTVRCTANLPYSFSLDSTTGTVGGLNYTLTTPAASSGTGAAQNHTIVGSIAGGQGGDATAPTTQVRTLTITY